MRQTLFWIPYDVAGWPLFGTGILLALCAVVGVVQSVRAWRRGLSPLEACQELLPTALLALAVWWVPAVFPGGLPIRGYGVMMLAGIVAGLTLAIRRAQHQGLSADRITGLGVWMVASGIVGARLFHVIEYWESDYKQPGIWATLLAVVNVPRGGLVVYGALFGAAVGFFCYVRRHRLPPLALADLIAPSLAIGLALGRVGCFLNGCCFGGLCDHSWAVLFPEGSPPYEWQVRRGLMHGLELEPLAEGGMRVEWVEPQSAAGRAGLRVGDIVRRVDGIEPSRDDSLAGRIAGAYVSRPVLDVRLSDGRSLRLEVKEHRSQSLPVHPTQLYSAITAGLLALLLWNYYPFRRRDGEVIALCLTLYAPLRFLLETIRRDEPSVFGTGLSISQNISILMLAAVAGLWIYVGFHPGVSSVAEPSP